jgi:hypothetical protein
VLFVSENTLARTSNNAYSLNAVKRFYLYYKVRERNNLVLLLSTCLFVLSFFCAVSVLSLAVCSDCEWNDTCTFCLRFEWSIPLVCLDVSRGTQQYALVKVGRPMTLLASSILMGKAVRYSSTVFFGIS